jgi:hypothetical protein
MQSILVYQIKPDPGVFAKSFLPNDVMFISTDKLLPMSRFTNPSAGSGAASGGRSSRGGGGRAMRFVFGIYLLVFGCFSFSASIIHMSRYVFFKIFI